MFTMLLSSMLAREDKSFTLECVCGCVVVYFALLNKYEVEMVLLKSSS